MNDKRLHNILIAILDMMLILFIFFLGVNAMVWTIDQVKDLQNECCAICLSRSQGQIKDFKPNSSNISSIVPFVNR